MSTRWRRPCLSSAAATCRWSTMLASGSLGWCRSATCSAPPSGSPSGRDDPVKPGGRLMKATDRRQVWWSAAGSSATWTDKEDPMEEPRKENFIATVEGKHDLKPDQAGIELVDALVSEDQLRVDTSVAVQAKGDKGRVVIYLPPIWREPDVNIHILRETVWRRAHALWAERAEHIYLTSSS